MTGSLDSNLTVCLACITPFSVVSFAIASSLPSPISCQRNHQGLDIIILFTIKYHYNLKEKAFNLSTYTVFPISIPRTMFWRVRYVSRPQHTLNVLRIKNSLRHSQLHMGPVFYSSRHIQALSHERLGGIRR